MEVLGRNGRILSNLIIYIIKEIRISEYWTCHVATVPGVIEYCINREIKSSTANVDQSGGCALLES